MPTMIDATGAARLTGLKRATLRDLASASFLSYGVSSGGVLYFSEEELQHVFTAIIPDDKKTGELPDTEEQRRSDAQD